MENAWLLLKWEGQISCMNTDHLGKVTEELKLKALLHSLVWNDLVGKSGPMLTPQKCTTIKIHSALRTFSWYFIKINAKVYLIFYKSKRPVAVNYDKIRGPCCGTVICLLLDLQYCFLGALYCFLGVLPFVQMFLFRVVRCDRVPICRQQQRCSALYEQVVQTLTAWWQNYRGETSQPAVHQL